MGLGFRFRLVKVTKKKTTKTVKGLLSGLLSELELSEPDWVPGVSKSIVKQADLQKQCYHKKKLINKMKKSKKLKKEYA